MLTGSFLAAPSIKYRLFSHLLNSVHGPGKPLKLWSKIILYIDCYIDCNTASLKDNLSRFFSVFFFNMTQPESVSRQVSRMVTENIW